MATDPTGRISHVQDMHRGLTWKPACRVATTAPITISTALNNGDTLDGITLATGDRVLVKDQAAPSQNGIYIVGATPTRAADMDQDTTATTVPAEEIAGAVVFVISGTVNTKTIWYTTNAVGGTIGSTSIVWTQFSGGGFSDPMTTRGDIIIRNAANATARLGKGAAGTILTSDGTDVSWGNGPMTTKGDLIVGDTGGAPIRKAVGSNTQVLTADSGSTGGLKWAAASAGGSGVGHVFLESHTASSSATLDFTTFISSDFDTYRFEFVKLVPANNADALWMRMGTGGGPTYDSTVGHYQWSAFIQVASASASVSSTSAAQIAMQNSGISNVSSRGGISGYLELFDPQSSTDEKLVTGQFVNRQTTNADAPASWTVGGLFQQTTAVTAVRFLMSSGNIASGTVRVYGVSKS